MLAGSCPRPREHVGRLPIADVSVAQGESGLGLPVVSLRQQQPTGFLLHPTPARLLTPVLGSLALQLTLLASPVLWPCAQPILPLRLAGARVWVPPGSWRGQACRRDSHCLWWH